MRFALQEKLTEALIRFYVYKKLDGVKSMTLTRLSLHLTLSFEDLQLLEYYI